MTLFIELSNVQSTLTVMNTLYSNMLWWLKGIKLVYSLQKMLKLVDSEFNAIDTIRLLSLSMIRASKILIQAKL